MAITDYASLQASVANWLHRSDLTGQIQDFIALAEQKLNADIDARQMDARASMSTAAGAAYVNLPSDLLEMYRLSVQTNPVRVLKYTSPDQLAVDYPTATPGVPAIFSIVGTQLQLAPTPDAAYTLECTYRQRIPALSKVNPSNWLLQAYPGAYLYGALCAAQPYIVNDARLPTFQALYREAVDGINSIDWYSGTTMTVRTR